MLNETLCTLKRRNRIFSNSNLKGYFCWNHFASIQTRGCLKSHFFLIETIMFDKNLNIFKRNVFHCKYLYLLVRKMKFPTR